MKTTNFVAIDFETMTGALTSACAIGLVKVINGNIQQSYYSLINPIPDDNKYLNTSVHGITLEMVSEAPTFAQLFPVLESFIGSLPIVCHNRGADINIMHRCMDYYGLKGIDTANNYCTFEMTGQSLTACCAKFGISMGVHHNALDDAMACAKVFLACQGDIVATTFKVVFLLTYLKLTVSCKCNVATSKVFLHMPLEIVTTHPLETVVFNLVNNFDDFSLFHS